MPNAREYRDAALRYSNAGEHLHRLAAVLSGWRLDSHIGSGPVADAVTEQLTAIAAELRAAADELARVALFCRQRASVLGSS